MDQGNAKYNRILDAAIKVFAEQGFYQATISQVAKEAGVADGTIYLYFKNKSDILSNFLSYKTRMVFDRFRQAVDNADNAEEKLKSLIGVHLADFQKDRDMAVVFQREALLARCIDEEDLRKIIKMYTDILEDILRQGQKEGTIRGDMHIGLAKRFILGAVNEIINTWVVTGKVAGGGELADMAGPLVDLYFKGIGKE
ncbi:MAG: TetR/AcrR family transcriptional regulator [Desulfobacteraceae bacterium]|nr:TetR/AcrR family transcriptional regulator [Desulfobacteraceae bacterium]MCF8093973.1 TetR/AcrR family transcriptional regulator [Desulfobacteraceae bacterium]